MTGPYSTYSDTSAALALQTANDAANSREVLVRKASEYVTIGLASRAATAALEAEAIVAVEHERAAQLALAAKDAHAHSFVAGALSSKLSQILASLEGLDEGVAQQAAVIGDLAARAKNLGAETKELMALVRKVEVDHRLVSEQLQNRALELSVKQSEALDSLANAQVAANAANVAAREVHAKISGGNVAPIEISAPEFVADDDTNEVDIAPDQDSVKIGAESHEDLVDSYGIPISNPVSGYPELPQDILQEELSSTEKEVVIRRDKKDLKDFRKRGFVRFQERSRVGKQMHFEDSFEPSQPNPFYEKIDPRTPKLTKRRDFVYDDPDESYDPFYFARNHEILRETPRQRGGRTETKN